ncbi:hypothetical protein F7725_026268 [Dissostichus mawsoni]|uniref:Uncharacterized protein n=1 Tax=Dissostichus mawsoni TaxID=36200 RepID=A0A7J5X6X7_DISMA|nr:hypothetical protein F7725_026268 [Dissostichus mawsoni]
MDFLGIPSCAGFGPHAESYRFLIFPNMGQSLHSVMEEEDELLSEKAVLQLACRIVYLVGYCHACRYCPGDQHVEYREDSGRHTRAAWSSSAWTLIKEQLRLDAATCSLWVTACCTGTQGRCHGLKSLTQTRWPRRNRGAFQAYLTNVMALQYTEQPDYSALKAGLSAVLLQLGGQRSSRSAFR